MLLMLQHWAHSGNRRPTVTDEKNILYFGCDFRGWYNFGKIITVVATMMSYFKAEMHQIRFRLGLRPDPLGDLTALAQTPSWI